MEIMEDFAILNVLCNLDDESTRRNELLEAQNKILMQLVESQNELIKCFKSHKTESED